MGKAERQSNIELLRILTMCGVVILHYNNKSMGGGFAYATGLNLYVLYFLESIFACAVNLFVLVSGYFMCEQQKRTLAKPFELLVQVVLFNELLYFASTIVHHEPISIKHIMGHLIPANWFVILYVTLYLISPLLNMVIQKAESAYALKKLIIMLILLFSVYPTLVDMLGEVSHKEYVGLSSIGMYGSQWGYSIVNFSVMYMIGGYLRKRSHMGGNRQKHVIAFVMTAIILTIWAVINDKIGFSTERSAWEYCNPLVIFMAVEAFCIFQKFDMGCHKHINQMAKASFTVYLLHFSFFKFLRIPYFVTINPIIMLLHIVASAGIIYLTCVLIYKVYNKGMTPILSALYRRCPFFEKDIFAEWSD